MYSRLYSRWLGSLLAGGPPPEAPRGGAPTCASLSNGDFQEPGAIPELPKVFIYVICLKSLRDSDCSLEYVPQLRTFESFGLRDVAGQVTYIEAHGPRGLGNHGQVSYGR